ncbi:uncharacterized protein LOC122064391 [Macadamia integrifolia]|uniref:uncharacterized protein LOC122064391 n=1 Tax=Macadamia integrifolia TaxID=60698 RepID=UPI001C4FF5D3|nr:uncharacterized protein LOC122064391 [Macadamia integrifolia]XP_042484045.1 uncharacterized protein LOC122064391 [Macadamia integrifolia]XP_042484046.1 uncharacterized protein LOC122064391 [Macadamia integrifolia]
MLHKSFKSGKCKTSLKLAAARIKLLKNKREVQVKQLRRELAQLLESGQEKTARIRVEHVVREEKTMAAYDLLEIYCELIVARLPIIESQKSCPIDLKEAIASVVFAAPRCADIPELLDVRKHFTAKYGKEFVTSALELRPECGVGRMMIEKLSAKAPDGETKMKILSTIAQEHNINWDPASLVDNDSKPTDFLNGPSTFEDASKTTVKPPDVRFPPDPGYKYESSTNLPDHNVSIPPLGSQVSASTETSTSTRMPATYSPEPRASESRTERQEYGRPLSRNEDVFPRNGQNWNMEFTDATSAAQAAAESAERASMAARAAADLSSRGNIMRQYSTESNKSSVYGFRNEGSRTSGSKSQEPFTKDSAEVVWGAPGSSSEIGNLRMQNQSRDREETLPGVSENKFGGEASVKRRPSKSISSESGITSLDNETPVVSSQKADRYYEKRSSTAESISPSWQGGYPEKADYVDEESPKRRSSQSELDSFYQQPQNERSEYADNYGDGRTRKQSSRSSSSHTSADGDHIDVISNANLEEYWNVVDDNSLFTNDRGNVQVGTEQSVVFDEFGSDDDYNNDSGAKYNGHGSSFFFPSPGRESPQHLSTVGNTWNPIENRGENLEKKPRAEEHFFTDLEPPFKSSDSEQQIKSGVPSQSDDLAPATFDDSEGLSSESEVDDLHTGGKTGSGSGLHNSIPRSPSPPKNDRSHSPPASSIKNEVTRTNRKVILPSSSDDLDFEEAQLGRNQDVKLNAVGDSSEEYGFTDMSSRQSSPGHRRSVKRSDDSAQEPLHRPVTEEQPLRTSKFSSAKVEENPSALESNDIMNSESELGLNLRKLTGGLRNKGFQHPPYTRAPLGDTSLLSQNQSTVDTPTKIEQPSVTPKMKTPLVSGIRNQKPYNQKVHIKAHKESSSVASKTILDSDSDDAHEASPLQTVGSRSYMAGRRDDGHDESPRQTVGRRSYMDGRRDDAREESPRHTVGRRSYMDSRHDVAQESPCHTVGRRSYMDARLSRRTKDFPKQSETVSSEVAVTTDAGMVKNNSRSSPAAEHRRKPQSELMRSGSAEDSKLAAPNAPVQQKPSKPIAESKSAVHQESSKFSPPSSAVDQSSNVSNALPQTASSGSSGSPNTSSMKSTSRENSLKKEGHVHPKLPDYDTLAAHFHSLRSNRRA